MTIIVREVDETLKEVGVNEDRATEAVAQVERLERRIELKAEIRRRAWGSMPGSPALRLKSSSFSGRSGNWCRGIGRWSSN